MAQITEKRARRGRGRNHGLFQSGDRWGVDYRTPEGRRVRKLIGSHDEAKSERTKIEAAKKAGTYIDEGKSPTFEAFSKEYLSNVSAKKASHETEKRLMVNLVAEFGPLKLSKVTRQKVRDYHSTRAKAVSGATVNREIALLRHMMAVAIEDQKISINPARGGPGLKAFREVARERYLEMAEIKSLFDAIQARITKNEHQGTARKYWQYLRTSVTVALHTGMRKGEILGLRWSQINWEGQNIFLSKTKNGDTRRVPLDSITRHELTEHKTSVKNEELVFPSFDNDGNVVPLSDVKTAFKQALKDAGISDFHFHDLRHTFASHYVMKGGSVFTLSKILGHRDIKMTQRYAKLSPDFIQGEKERLDSIWTVAPKSGSELPSQVSSNLIQ